MTPPTHARPAPGRTPILEVLAWRTGNQPNRRAYTFLGPDGTEVARLTYEELDRRARAIAAHLRDANVTTGPVLLLYPPGLQYVAAIFGCLYAGAVAVPAYPPRRNRLNDRLHSIVADARAEVALTTSDLLLSIRARSDDTGPVGGLRWIATDAVDAATDGREVDIATNPDALALLQYTSGSTSAPKGVMVTHGNLQHNMALIARAFRLSEDDVGVFWLPSYHDMGLIGGVLGPAYLGVPMVLMSPVAFLQRPVRWLDAFARYRGSIGGGPNFAFDLCVQKVTAEQREQVDLRTWRVAFCGAEPIRANTLDRFANTFAATGFRRAAFFPCYGLAETTLIATGGVGPGTPVVHTVRRSALEHHRAVPAKPDESDALTLVGCGRPLRGMTIIIVDPETATPCPTGHVGEIWMAGPSIAHGYWNRSDETAVVFGARIAGNANSEFLRTGDLGFVRDGELFVTGRLKDVIVIRGRNHYPEDLEAVVEQSHPTLRPNCGAAFSIEVGGEERLVVVQEVKRQHLRTIDVDEVIGTIRAAVVREFELALYAVALLKTMGIPKTSSGKIQRRLCSAAFVQGKLDTIGEWRIPASGR